MPNFKQRSNQAELMDDLSLQSQELRQNLEELEIINYWLGGNKVVISALQTLYAQGKILPKLPLSIVDIGTGGGDLLRNIALWTRKKQLPAQLLGIDANAFMIQYAQEKAQKKYPEVSFEQHNIFSPSFASQQYDIAILSLFCHHFTSQELVLILNQLKKQVSIALIINDLHRHPLAYYGIKLLTKIAGGSALVQHDAPLSVLRAFKRTELTQLLTQSQWATFQIQWQWAFRYRVIAYV